MKEAETRGNAEEVAKILQKIAGVDDGVSKWNKTLENLTKEDKLSISDHLVVMERLFDALRRYDERLYLATLDFQEHYLQQITANG